MRILVLLFPLLLSACGFELRGAAVLPPELGKIHVSASKILYNDVEVFLEGSNTQLMSDRAQANVILTMSNPRYDRRILSVDPQTGFEREFELSYTLDVVATGPQGRVMLKPQTLSVRRDYVFDAGALIGSTQEETLLRTEMRRDLVQQVLYRLRAAVLS
jgi:LPS-assembly lipoprotein